VSRPAEGAGGPATAKRVDELGFYSLGAKQLSEKVGLTMPKAVAVVDYLGLRERADCYKEFKIGKTVHKRYSQESINAIRDAVKKESIEEMWPKRNQGKRTT
jgi:hypothetical protein